MNDEIQQALDAIEKRAEAATKGPWKLWGMQVQTDRDGSGIAKYEEAIADTRDPDRGMRTWNADFIAHARTDVPALAKALKVAVEAMHEMSDGRDEYAVFANETALATVRAILTGEGQ